MQREIFGKLGGLPFEGNGNELGAIGNARFTICRPMLGDPMFIFPEPSTLLKLRCEKGAAGVGPCQQARTPLELRDKAAKVEEDQADEEKSEDPITGSMTELQDNVLVGEVSGSKLGALRHADLFSFCHLTPVAGTHIFPGAMASPALGGRALDAVVARTCPQERAQHEPRDGGAKAEKIEVEDSLQDLAGGSATDLLGIVPDTAELMWDVAVFTAFVSNIPTHCHDADFSTALHAMGFGGHVLSFDMPTRANKIGRVYAKGFAFVHFADRRVCEQFVHAAEGFSFGQRKSGKRLVARLAVESMF